ncbi:putative calcium-binding protein cml21-like isoform x2, partial [Globisporangium splendens]
MGTKHSVPVASTQNEGPSMPYSSFTMSGASSDGSSLSAPAAPHHLRQYNGDGSGSSRSSSPSFGKDLATIRPHEGAGNGSSSHLTSAASAKTALMTPLDLKITNALKELQKKRVQDSKEHVRSTFEEFDKGKKGYIVYADLESAFEKLGVSFSKEEIGQVFEESDMLEDGRLNFKEFLVCLAIGFMLHGNKLRIAFQLAVDAFLCFDVDGNGLINKQDHLSHSARCLPRDEMAMRLGTSTQLHSPTKKTSTLKERAGFHKESGEMSINAEIWERRFNEMDWNNDGTIQFKEFLMAFESWVGLDDDDLMDAK